MIEARVYPSHDPSFYATVELRTPEDAETLLTSIAAYGLEFDGHTYREHQISGAWSYVGGAVYFGICFDTGERG